MILLVVGLVAVIVVILIAVFLSIRLGRGDEHDDEPDIRPSGRDRRDEEDRWREPDIRDARRAPAASRAAGRGERPGGMDDRRRASEPAYGARSAVRDRDRGAAASGHTTPPYDTGPRRPVREDTGPRRPVRDDTGPRRPARDDTGPRRPAREPAEFGSSSGRRRSPVPTGEGRGRPDTGPSRRVAADGFPSGEYPAADHPSLDFPAADYSSGELPSVPARAGKPRPDAGRSDSRRKAAPTPAASKSRSKPLRGKRDDDDDWPSGEWEKLSDEQYWAELSADKPLANMARPASNGKAPADEPARSSRAARKPAGAAAAGGGAEEPARPAAAAGRSPGRAQPPREPGRESRGRRERPPQHEPVTERLPVRSRHPSLDAGLPAARATSGHAPRDTGPLPARDTGRHPSLDTGPLPARDTGRHPSLDTGPLPARDTGRHPSLDTGPRPVHDPSLAMLTGLAGTPRPPVPGALDDDPLTSPSFSLREAPTTDSRSYGHARKSTREAADPGSAPLTSHSLAGNGTGRESGSYPVADYASPGYAYSAEPAAAAQWYSAPPAEPAPPPAYGNPYSYPGGGSPADYQGNTGHGSYLADPLHVYSPPQYEAPVSAYPDPSSAPYQALPALGMSAPSMEPAGHAPYPEAYQEHPYGPAQGQPEAAQYQDGYAGGGYAPSYENGYGGDPYAGGGYGT